MNAKDNSECLTLSHLCWHQDDEICTSQSLNNTVVLELFYLMLDNVHNILIEPALLKYLGDPTIMQWESKKVSMKIVPSVNLIIQSQLK